MRVLKASVLSSKAKGAFSLSIIVSFSNIFCQNTSVTLRGMPDCVKVILAPPSLGIMATSMRVVIPGKCLAVRGGSLGTCDGKMM